MTHKGSKSERSSTEVYMDRDIGKALEGMMAPFFAEGVEATERDNTEHKARCANHRALVICSIGGHLGLSPTSGHYFEMSKSPDGILTVHDDEKPTYEVEETLKARQNAAKEAIYAVAVRWEGMCLRICKQLSCFLSKSRVFSFPFFTLHANM
jgi:hypothetical protein